MAFNWAGAAAGVQDALQVALKQRLLEAESAQRQQQIEQQAQAQQINAQIAQQNADSLAEGRQIRVNEASAREAQRAQRSTWAKGVLAQEGPMQSWTGDLDRLRAQSIEATGEDLPESAISSYVASHSKPPKDDTMSPERLAQEERLINARNARGENAPRPSPIQLFDRTRLLRNDFQRETKSLNEVKRQVGLMKASIDQALKGNMNSASQGVLVTFQKILDPTSVVRESEYARSASGLSLLGQIQGYKEKLERGGAGVTAKDLQDFYTTASLFAKNAERSYAQIKDQYTSEAAELGVDPKRIARDWDLPDEAPPAAAPTAATGATKEQWTRDANGKLVRK